MERVELEITPRNETGSAVVRRYRREGLVPVVVYSHGERSVHGLIQAKDFIQKAKLSKSSQIFQLKSSIAELDGKAAVIKEIQKNHLKGTPLHVDFQWLRDDEEIGVRVVLKFVGEAPGVKLENGILAVVSHELAVRCLPRLIPDQIVVDVSTLHLGQSIHARELQLVSGVSLDGNPEETIVSVVAVRQVVEETPAAAAAPTAEGGEQAAAAEGAQAGATPEKEKEKK